MVDYRKAVPDDESLKRFLATLADFDQRFCNAMASGTDFTLRIEIHGDAGELLHCRVNDDCFRRPPGVEKRVEQRRKNS
jgi:hypothetical protein